MRKPAKLMIVDDHNAIRQGLAALLKEFSFPIIYEASNGKDAVEQLKEFQPDVILMDLEMPVMGGVEALQIIKQNYPSIKVIIFTGHHEQGYVIETLKSGADAFLLKNCNIDELVKLIGNLNKEKSFVYRNTQEPILTLGKKLNPEMVIGRRALTFKEAEILVAICEGKSRKLMADHFKVSESTVGFHVDNIYKKTKTSSIAALVIYAVQNGYISIGKP